MATPGGPPPSLNSNPTSLQIPNGRAGGPWHRSNSSGGRGGQGFDRSTSMQASPGRSSLGDGRDVPNPLHNAKSAPHALGADPENVTIEMKTVGGVDPSPAALLGNNTVGEMMKDQSRVDLEKGESIKELDRRAQEEAERNAGRVQEKAAGKDLAEVDAANNSGAFDKLASGKGVGQLFETISIALNFFQNFGLVGLLSVPWPESFR